MPYTIVVESYCEFAERHGGQSLHVNDWLVFPSGARVHASDQAYRQEPPPAGTVENIQARLVYWRAADKRSEQDFHREKSAAHQQAQLAARYGNLPGPSYSQLQFIKDIAEANRKARSMVADLEKQLAEKAVDHPERQRLEFMKNYELAQQARAAALSAEIEAINI